MVGFGGVVGSLAGGYLTEYGLEKWCFGAKGCIENHNAVRLDRTAWKLSVAQQSVRERADPDVKVLFGIPRGGTSRGLKFNWVSLITELGLGRLSIGNSIRCLALRIRGCESKLDHRISNEATENRRSLALVRIRGSKVTIENRTLASHLRLGNSLRRTGGIIYHMHHASDLVRCQSSDGCGSQT